MGLNIKEYDKIQKSCRDVALKKNNDYGCTTLTDFGIQGVVVRMNDKMERLKHLTWYNKTQRVKEEKIEDTAADLINYATYLIMLLRGKLEEDE